MRYVMARIDNEIQTIAYRVFVTDSLKAIGSLSGIRYAEYITDLHTPADDRTADDIINNVKNELNNMGGG